MIKTHRPQRQGIILLVVLSSLTFFSLLVAAYLVFSNQSRQSSFVLAARNTRAPDVNGLINEALMTLVRGTSDKHNPFYGEDLLSDFYGHDGFDMRLQLIASTSGNPDPNADGPLHLGSGIVRIPAVRTNTVPPSTPPPQNGTRGYTRMIDDLYAGRLITFTTGRLTNKTFRVLRSKYDPGSATMAECDYLYIELARDDIPSNTPATPSPAEIRSLFYKDATDLSTGWHHFHLNGVPLNSPGVGYEGANINLDVSATGLSQPNPLPPSATPPSPPTVGFGSLPIALQPNHIRLRSLGSGNVDKSAIITAGGDFDEDYDAADFNNWFLSFRNADGTIIPSFHRPSVINYILNEKNWNATTSRADFTNGLVSIARATFRPIPIADNQLGTGVNGINTRFTGGSDSFSLRAPLFMSGTTAPSRLNQLAIALINGPWDVDNDADGTPDSVWIDLGLPLITSPEGRLLRPMVAPMIEDLSARLNVNAHGNPQLNKDESALQDNSNAFWAGSRHDVLGTPVLASRDERTAFRGIGYGPAEIMIPAVSSTSGVITNANVLAGIDSIINDRYRSGFQISAPELPGTDAADVLDVVRTGFLPTIHTARGGYGHSVDPYGRGGVAMGRSGDIVAADSGRSISTTPVINEAVNDPYEFDPSGNLDGDAAFSVAELETILRSNEFDNELLPSGLRNRALALINQHREFRRSLTALSKSNDTPSAIDPTSETPLNSLIQRILDVGGAAPTPLQLQMMTRSLIAPEIRLGRKLDVNRPFGNGVDDSLAGTPGEGVIDEPSEVFRADEGNGLDDDADGITDERGELTGERHAFVASTNAGSVPPSFNNATLSVQHDDPSYTFDEPAITYSGSGPTVTTPQIGGRQLLARHLYVLMMSLTDEDFQFPSIGGTPFTTAQAAAYKARRLAQWAVNVVDYRDPDSIMTRFVFDENPLDGWSPPVDTFATPAPPSNVVWGVEAPELMFSESAAFHDVRVRDTPYDSTTDDRAGGDNDTDQVRVPEGSLFLELYCPHPTVNLSSVDQSTKRSLPQELYNDIGSLDIGATAPSVTGTGSGAPIWRIAITEPHAGNPADPDVLRTTYPDSASFEITNPDELGGFAGPNLGYDRFIWFGNQRTTVGPVNNAASGFSSDFATVAAIQTLVTNENITDMTGLENGVFYASDLINGSGHRQLAPGQFLVLGPRAQTHLGSRSDGSGVPLYPSRQRFSISGGGSVHYRNTNSTTNPPIEVRTSPLFGATQYHTTPQTLIVGSFLPIGWSPTSFQHGVPGLSVSEPLHSSYYPGIPSRQYNGTGAGNQQDNDGYPGPDYPLTDAYLDLMDTVTSQALDEPLDVTVGILPVAGAEPQLGTIPSFCSALLQRLADPTLPYNEITNPYRTVDWIQIDLTVFSGEARPSADLGQGGALYTPRSRQRTGNGSNILYSYAVNDADFSPFPLPTNMVTVADAGSTELDFFNLQHVAASSVERYLFSSFGFLNTPTYTQSQFVAGSVGDEPERGHSNPGFIGYAPSIGSEGSPAADNVIGNDRNLPTTPYALHPWLNRPFTSHLELMMVPGCSQARLFEEFSTVTGDPAIYPDGGATNVFREPFGHLLNFFHSSFDRTPTAPATSFSGAAQFARIFDFVHTLPRFRGEVEMIAPVRLATTNSAPSTLLDIERDGFRELLAPPFNFRYDGSRQGTINLNTLAEFPVWAGLMQGHLNTPEFQAVAGGPNANQLSFDQFVSRRRGYTTPGPGAQIPLSPAPDARPYNYDAANLDPTLPTQFANVFRDSVSAHFAPLLQNRLDPNATASPPSPTFLRRRGTSGTVLGGAGALSTNDPLGGSPGTVSAFVRAAGQQPLPASEIHQDRGRNPFLRYQTLMRMPNLVSDNSQTFVIWLTLGFFEVDADNVNSIGEEYKADIGENERYRAMFIVDRSIPVGFVPGEDLNARDVVVFESYAQ